MILFGIVLLAMISNLLFFKSFYINNKRRSINEAYKIINNASLKNKLKDPSFHKELLNLCEASDLSVLILDANGNQITTEKIDEYNYETIISEPPFSEYILAKEEPEIEIINDSFSGIKYLEMK